MLDVAWHAYAAGNFQEYLRILNGCSMEDILDTVQRIRFEHNIREKWQTFETDLNQAGVYVERLRLAFNAIYPVGFGQTVEDYEKLNGLHLNELPSDQQQAVRTFVRKYFKKAGAYEGEILTDCPDLDMRVVWAVIVTGDFPNPCGHALLCAPATNPRLGRYYFQVAGFYTFPRIMDDQGFARYLREHSKREIRRHLIMVPNPSAAYTRLEQTAQKPWFWAVLPHNCAAYIEDIVNAGGSTAGLYSNCPKWENKW